MHHDKLACVSRYDWILHSDSRCKALGSAILANKLIGIPQGQQQSWRRIQVFDGDGFCVVSLALERTGTPCHLACEGCGSFAKGTDDVALVDALVAKMRLNMSE